MIFERARFNRRCQNQDESVEQCLYQNCAYGELRDEMIHDRIVVGIWHEAMSQKLWMDTDLVLESAKKKVRQREAVWEQLKSGFQEEGLPVEAIGNWGAAVHSQKRAKPINKTTKTSRPQPTTLNKCTRYGKGPHSRQHCPAKEATCHHCEKKGHYKSQCFLKMSEVTKDCSTELEDPFCMQSAMREIVLHGTSPFRWMDRL